MNELYTLFQACSGVCTDTRKLEANCLFICLSGTNFNGNTFALEALDKGAKFVLVDDERYATEERIHYVQDCLLTLQKLANHHRKQFEIPLIGITGSNGKTSTKELIYAVLSQKYNTLATQGNLNNHIGVPLTLLKLNSSHEIAVIEMGANKLKDIEELCVIAEPNFGIITNIGKAHLEGFINFEGVLRTKSELYQAVAQKKGVIFYNIDDPILVGQLPAQVPTMSYGTKEPADLRGELLKLNPFVQLRWSVSSYSSPPLQTQMIGQYNFYNFLAASCIGNYFHVDPTAISNAICTYLPSNNRSQLHQTKNNQLILDAYNANPTSMLSAIQSFSLMEHGKKIAILGDMFELGQDSDLEHLHLIEATQDQDFNCVFIGEHFYKHRISAKHGDFYASRDAFMQRLEDESIKSSLILIKGSRGVGLENLIEKL